MKRAIALIALVLIWVPFVAVRAVLASDVSVSAPDIGEVSEATACAQCHAQIFQASGHTVSIGPGGRRSPPLGGTALDTLDCLTCHVPHSEVQPKQLRSDRATINLSSSSITFDPATRLCLSCHPLAGEFKGWGRDYVRHPVGIPVRKPGVRVDAPGFPPLVDVKGTQDVSDDVIGCTTCHAFHAGSNPFLLRWGVKELPAACLKCHPEVAPAAPGTFDRSHGVSLGR